MTDFMDERLMEHRRRMFRSMKRKNTSVKTREWAVRMGIKHVHSLGWGCHEGCTDGLTPPVREPGKKRLIAIRGSPRTLEKSLLGKRKRQATLESKRRMAQELTNGGH